MLSPFVGATKRYPWRGKVSMNWGFSAESPSALPEFLDGVVQAVVELDECVCGPQAGYADPPA